MSSEMAPKELDLREMDTRPGEATVKLICHLSEKSSILKGKKLCRFRVDPFSEGDWCSGKKRNLKSCLPWKWRGSSVKINCLLTKRRFFPFKVDSFHKEAAEQESNQETITVYFFVKKIADVYNIYSPYLKISIISLIEQQQLQYCSKHR